MFVEVEGTPAITKLRRPTTVRASYPPPLRLCPSRSLIRECPLLLPSASKKGACKSGQRNHSRHFSALSVRFLFSVGIRSPCARTAFTPPAPARARLLRTDRRAIPVSALPALSVRVIAVWIRAIDRAVAPGTAPRPREQSPLERESFWSARSGDCRPELKTASGQIYFLPSALSRVALIGSNSKRLPIRG
jgi:hypothetical protein